MEQKNKKVQYVLAVLVLVIWGAIAMQFFNYSGGSLDIEAQAYTHLPIAKPQTGETFKFGLSLDYNDPFFASKKKSATITTTSPLTTNNRKKIPKHIQQKINHQRNKKMPKVIYKGYSLNNNQITRVNLSINKKVISMKIGDAQDGVLLKKTYRDSLLISFMGEEQIIFRTK